MREDKFWETDGRHMSAKEAALFIKTDAVGPYYKTHGEVYDIPHETRVVGLLEAILDEIFKSASNPDERRLDNHREYLQKHWAYDTSLIAKLGHEIDRVTKLCGGCMDELDRSYDIHRACAFNVSKLASIYASCPYSNADGGYLSELRLVAHYIKKLRKIRKLDDLKILHNIGLGTVAKIKARLEART